MAGEAVPTRQWKDTAMSNTSDLNITVFNINSMLSKLEAEAKVRVSTSYGKKRLYIDTPNGPRDTPPQGPKDCLMFAEGMERALELIYYGRES